MEEEAAESRDSTSERADRLRNLAAVKKSLAPRTRHSDALGRMASDILPGSGGGRRGGMSGRTSGSGRGAGNDDDGEHPSPSRHRFDGRKLRQTVNNRLMATAAVDGMRRDVSRDTHDNTQTDYKASRESSASEVFESQKQALHEAQLLLQDTIENENDEDLLLPEDLDGAELPEERARRLFAAGVFDDPMSKKSSNLQEKLATKSAWSVEPLQPTEEDKMKQRVYEKVHLRKHRRRHAVHLYGDPDQFEELQLDSDVVKGEHHKFLKEMYGTQTGLEKTNKDGDNKTGTILAAVFGAGSSDPSSVPQVSPFQSPSKQSPGKNSRRMLSPGGLEDASPSATSIRASPGGSSVVSPSQNPLLHERADKRDDKIAPQDARARQVDIAAQAALAARLEHIPVTLRGCITPSEIDTPEGSRVVKINGGPKHCAVLLDVSEIIERILPRHREHAGRVLMLGGNEFGQLGVGDKFNRTTPAVLQTIRDTNGTGQGGGGRVVDHGGNHLGGHGVNNKRVVDIACGGMHTVCVTHDSSAAAFGTDRSGSCGQGESGRDQSFLLPRIIHWVSRDTMRVSAAACGDSHTLLLTVDGRVLSLGDGGFGKLGHGEDGFQDSLDDGKRFRHHTKPTRIKELDGLRIVSIACGKNHSACVTDSGLAYAWGKNTYGQLGTGSFHDQSTPHRAGHAEWHGGEVVSAVDHENDDESGTKNSATSKTFQLQERLLGKLEGANARFIPYGEVHRPFAQPTELQLETAALKREAKLGIRRVGDVGGDETNNSYNSEKSKSVTGATVKTKKYPVVQIAGGNSHTVFLSAAGRVYTCGSNLHGQLGMGEREPSQDVSSSPVPKLVSSLVNLRVTNVASGSDHVACRTALGVVYVWGGNFEGQLGDGTVADAHSPKPLIPELVEQQNTPPWKVRQIKGHPMFGLTCENVFACGTSTFAVVEGGQRVFVCGAGVPFEEGVVAGAGRRATQAPTDTATHTSTSTDSKPNLGDFRGGGANTPVTTFSKMLSTKLSDVENKRALVMESTVRMLTPDERSFDDLTSQMLAYAPYDEYVLVRVLNTVISEVIEKPAFHVMYGSLLERLVKFKCLKCPNSHFRRVILLAVEHAGVSMLKRQDGVMHARMLKTLGWARYQKWLTGEFQGLQKLGDGTQLKDSANLSYYDSIVDKKSYEDFRKFRDECKALQGLLRDLYEHRGVLLADDINNVAAGFPGSEHSVKIVSSETAWKKVRFFVSFIP